VQKLPFFGTKRIFGHIFGFLRSFCLNLANNREGRYFWWTPRQKKHVLLGKRQNWEEGTTWEILLVDTWAEKACTFGKKAKLGGRDPATLGLGDLYPLYF
tara:strand:- start:388 stop:687 length:300 start_codon:yes stop_codon:yes gene_type:complete